MRVGFVTHTYVPHPTGAGVPIMNWAVVKHLAERGHQVNCFLLLPPSAVEQAEQRERQLALLRELGVSVTTFTLSTEHSKLNTGGRLLRAAVYGRLEDLYLSDRLRRALTQAVLDARVDALYLYTMTSIVAARDVPRMPRLAALVDLDFMARHYRWRHANPADPLNWGVFWLQHVGSRRLPKLTCGLLAGCQSVIGHAAHHASWLREHGVANCVYLPNPVADNAGPDWAARRSACANQGKPKILMPGHLRGIATLSGLQLFFNEVLPELERELGPDGFEVHIVGREEPPSDLAPLMRRPAIRHRGFVGDVHHEFLSSDVLVVPTPIDLGFRTRIAEGFSFGCCVAAHSANALGIAEMRDGENCLLGDSGPALARQIIRAVRDPELRRRLGASARQVYEAKMQPSVVCAHVEWELERIAARQPAPSDWQRLARSNRG